MSPLHHRSPSTDNYEMSNTQEEEEVSYPLLENGQSPNQVQERTRRRSNSNPKQGVIRRVSRTWWKPIALLSTPFILIIIYALVNEQVGLPPLPKVTIQHGQSGELVSKEGMCDCGESLEGDRLCSIYQVEGLVHSRAVEGSGARIRRVLDKAKAGHGLKIGVLGGSGMSFSSEDGILPE